MGCAERGTMVGSTIRPDYSIDPWRSLSKLLKPIKLTPHRQRVTDRAQSEGPRLVSRLSCSTLTATVSFRARDVDADQVISAPPIVFAEVRCTIGAQCDF